MHCGKEISRPCALLLPLLERWFIMISIRSARRHTSTDSLVWRRICSERLGPGAGV